MLIDVVVPNYNRTVLLKRAIISALNQDGINRIYIVDDGSDTKTTAFYPEVLALSDSIELLSHEHSGDPGNLRNSAIRISNADWIAFLDSDDFWEPGRIKKTLDFLENGSLNLFCSNAKKLFTESEKPTNLYLHNRPSNKFGVRDLMVENFVITSTVLVRRSAIIAVGCFPTGKKVKNCEDFATWLRIATLEGCYFDSSSEVIYTYSEDSFSRNRGLSLDSKALSNFLTWIWRSPTSIRYKLLTSFLVLRVRCLRFTRRLKTTLRIRRR